MIIDTEFGTVSISDNVYKECEEEIGLSKYIANIRIIGIATSNHATSIVTTADCHMSSEEIKGHMEKNRDKVVDSFEASEMEFVDYTIVGIDSILNNNEISIGSMSNFALDCLKKDILRD